MIIGMYDELSPGMGYPKMKDDLQETPQESKQIILEYLRSGHVYMVTASRMVDVYSGKNGGVICFMNDGKYSWSSEIPYYVDKYNLKLPKHFEDHILSQVQ